MSCLRWTSICSVLDLSIRVMALKSLNLHGLSNRSVRFSVNKRRSILGRHALSIDAREASSLDVFMRL